MTFLKGIVQVGILYVFYLLGAALQKLLHLPLPGSIIGMILLLTALSLKIVKTNWVVLGAKYLLAILPLLLVPATIGVMKYPALFTGKGVLIFLMVIVSTIITIVVTARTSQYLEKRAVKKKEERECINHLSQ